MAKTYKKISGTWYPIKKIFKRISGTWSEVKKLYKKVSGTWHVVHSGALEYTFASSITSTSTTGILLSSYVNPASADEFVITVNSGVILRGKAGTTGATGVSGADGDTRTNCHGSGSYFGGNGAIGGSGYPTINFTGFAGKKITFVINGSIIGGAGGTGGYGGACGNASMMRCGYTAYGGCGGAGGAGGAWSVNTASVTIVTSGNAPTSGSTGAAGANNPTTIDGQAC